MIQQTFHGDKKLPLKSPLARIERKFIDFLTPKFPRWIEGYQLTLLTIVWSIGIICAGYYAQKKMYWLWLSNLCLVLQWFTDSFDGALGRYRDFGIPRWGFFMDHFLDYIFMCAICIGYVLFFSPALSWVFWLLIVIYGGFMMNSYLGFSATDEFKITFLGVGPTEVRLILVLVNCLILCGGKGFVEKVLIYVPPLFFVSLCIVVYRTQRHIWIREMQAKQRGPHS